MVINSEMAFVTIFGQEQWDMLSNNPNRVRDTDCVCFDHTEQLVRVILG